MVGIQKITAIPYAGRDKNSSKGITITTWQSIYKMPKKWFEKFDVVIGDEAHQFKM